MNRPTPRWVRIASIVTVIWTIILLALGGFVTTFRAGMADPVWPTEPWYLANNFKLDLAYLIEHIHRIAGWMTGISATIFVFGAWLAESKTRTRFLGLLCLFGLLVSYGEFHRSMGTIWNDVKHAAAESGVVDLKQPDAESKLTQLNLVSHVKKWPVAQGLATIAFAGGLLLFAASSVATNSSGGLVRLFGSIGLICVMAQGLLGGFRVFLNAIAGTNLAAIHGVFGQLVFAVLIAAMILCAPRKVGDSLETNERQTLGKLAFFTLAILFIQLIWASWVRHLGSPVAQRLHILTAFVVCALVILLVMKILQSESAVQLYRTTAIQLILILSFQILLGVEAYLGKFVAAGPQAQLMPFERVVTQSDAWIRTGHQFIGAGLLAAVVASCVRFQRRPVTATQPRLHAFFDSTCSPQMATSR